MKFRVVITLLLFCVSCASETDTNQTPFNASQWAIKEGRDYPYRDNMLHAIVYNDTIRSLSKTQVVSLLGKPDKQKDNHLYYLISQKRLFSWPLHTKTMVIKFTKTQNIEWIKIHE